MRAVLVVDDEPTMRLCLERVLSARGYTVFTAADADTALGAAQDANPDAIVLDAVPDDGRGYRLCSALRRACSTKDPKIVVVSAHSGPDHVDRCRAAGAHGYLSKPFAFGALMAEIDTLLEAP